MKNFNDLFLKSNKRKNAEKEVQSNMMAEMLAGNLKKLMCNNDFMAEAENLLADKGYFKIPLTAVFSDGQIYTAIENEQQTKSVFWRYEAPHILDSSSPLLQEKIKKDFTDFWESQGVKVLFVYECAILIVESLSKITKRKFLEANPQINGEWYMSQQCDTDYVFYNESKTIDITKYLPGPYCYIR